MTDTSTDLDASEPQPKPTLSVIDMYLLAQHLADALGDAWTVAEDFSPSQDSTIHLVHTEGHAIGIRHLFKGLAVQTFAIGGPSTEAPAGSTKPLPRRLAPGMRYSTGIFFTAEEPLKTVLTAIRTALLPAFDGHRLLLDSNGRRPQPVPATDLAPTEQPCSEPDSAGASAPKARARKVSTSRAKTPKPARRSTSSKKHSAASA